MEADFVTGPAKNLLEFAQRSARPEDNLPAVDLSIVAYLRGDQEETAFIRASRDARIPIDILHEGGRFDRSVGRQLRRIVEARDPDIVQSHNVKSHFFVRMSGIQRERLWLAFHHGYTTTDLKMRCYNAVNRWSLRRARHVVTTCGPFVDQLVRQGVRRERLSVQHNSVKMPQAVAAEAIRAARDGIAAAAGTPLLVSIGRLSREKGHVDLLRALATLRQRTEAFHLVVVGEGPERSRIEGERRRLNLEAHVTLVGLQHDVRPYYALADLVVLPSHSEGSPNVLLEAMLAGRPIVATSVGGVPEIVRHEDAALLVPPRDRERMTHALARMLTDESLRTRLARRARELAASDYSPEAYRRSMVRLYQRLLAAGESQ
jgi:glycosyltransferase involved in cell wall biosynthesis